MKKKNFLYQGWGVRRWDQYDDEEIRDMFEEMHSHKPREILRSNGAILAGPIEEREQC